MIVCYQYKLTGHGAIKSAFTVPMVGIPFFFIKSDVFVTKQYIIDGTSNIASTNNFPDKIGHSWEEDDKFLFEPIAAWKIKQKNELI